jgi:DNA-binding transcriptional LysR family regulator
MDIPWNDVRLFLAIADTGSLSAAARELGLAQPTVSRRLAQLEEQLGYPVFQRSVEGARPTAAGEKMLAPARRMAEWAGELEQIAGGGDASPSGVVRITAPPGVAFDFVAPFAARMRRALPEIQLQVLSSIRYLDLSRREADLALRIEPPAHRDLVTVASLEIDNVVCAAPSYIATLAERPSLADIDWIGWAPPFDHLSPNPELAQLIPGFQPAFASDDFLVQLRAAEAGVGAMVLGRPDARQARASVLEVVELDLDMHARSGLHLVATRSALTIPRIRAVVDQLMVEFHELGDADERG